jgi:predicted transcriptional regulator
MGRANKFAQFSKFKIAILDIIDCMTTLNQEDSAALLKGTSLDVYRLLLKANKPLGIREIQRSLNLSSPSVAQYHLSKLETFGLLKRENGNYVVNRFISENYIRVSHFLIPRFIFYCFFAFGILIFELLFFGPILSSRGLFFAIIATIIFLFIFIYETLKVWLKATL